MKMRKTNVIRVILLFGCVLLTALAFADEMALSWPDLSSAPKSAKGSSGDAALVIGISDYFSLDKIEGAVSNADDWREYLRQTKNIARQNIGFLTDKEAKDHAIRREANRIAKQVKPGGTIWFVFIGHGTTSSDGESGLLVGVDADGTADGLDSRSVRQTEIEAILNKSEASRVVMIVDACFSGRTSEGKPLAPGLQALVRPAHLKSNSKTILMTAAKNDQFAGPLPGAHRPAFSYLLLGALRGWGDENNDKNVTAEEAMDYVNGVFASLVRGRSQTPELTASRLNKRAVLSANAREKGPDIDNMVRQKIKGNVRTEDDGYIRIPAGSFVLSHDTITYRKGATVTLNAFSLKKTPVTVAEFQKCVEAGACRPDNFGDASVFSLCIYNLGDNWLNHPMNCVTWNGAKEYCEWVGGRLPSEEEWEYASTHNGKVHLNTLYPWGNGRPDASRANYGNYSEKSAGTTPVGKYSPAGDSPLGLVDMSGNVLEWTGSGSSDSDGDKSYTLKGGCWNKSEKLLPVFYRTSESPSRGDFAIGFRCAK